MKKLKALGAEVAVARGAGLGSGILDADYEAAGASVGDNVTKDADVVLKVRRPAADELNATRRARWSSPSWTPTAMRPRSSRWRTPGVVAFAMELMPRITRAQSMDVLSSQANSRRLQGGDRCRGGIRPRLADDDDGGGHDAGGEGVHHGRRRRGPAGDRHRARLGAIVTATDVRPATKEQVESLGAKFVAVEDEEFKNAQTAGGYAKEMSTEYQAKQAALIAEHIKKQDIVITTALSRAARRRSWSPRRWWTR